MKAPAHLAGRPVARTGRPVPYINVVGTWDATSRWRIAHDRNLGQVCAYYDDDPGGQPNFLKQSIQRQRECAYLGRCQVCARHVGWPDRRLVIEKLLLRFRISACEPESHEV